ncbi:hypothetical protein QYM36_005630 [Artemia franciscana]|uniref:VLIG-type G domain-containing protein n=1 Tax=Artemia franciscana TaxID=6661 RepID=A0AA88HZX9_ARTSF|nr:hypothetical protein QYM36_005630 [Artemia franciscana]
MDENEETREKSNDVSGTMISGEEKTRPVMVMKDPLVTYATVCERGPKIDTSSASAFVASVRLLENDDSTENGFQVQGEKATDVPADENGKIFLERENFPAVDLTANCSTVENFKQGCVELKASSSSVVNAVTSAGHTQKFQKHKPTHIEATTINGKGRNFGPPVVSEGYKTLKAEKNDNRLYENIVEKDKCQNEKIYENVISSSWPTEKQILSILEKLQLSVYWKYKLSLEKVKEFSMFKPSGANGSGEIVFKFFHKLFHNFADARNEFMLEKSNMEHNSMDLIYCILLIADDFLRQEIVSRMAVLQYSVPFCIKDPSGRYFLLNWSLLNISKRWKTLNGKSFIESDVHTGGFVYCSFIRIGDLSYSKSKAINKLFPKGNEPFQSYEEDDVSRSFTSGSLEISWLLPVRDEKFEPLAIVNMRGDAKKNQDLAQYAAKHSNILCIFVGDTTVEIQQLLLRLVRNHSRVVVISDKRVNADTMIKTLPTKTKFEYIKDTESRIVQKLKQLVLVNENRKKSSFSEWEKDAKSMNFLLEDANEHMQAARKAAEKLASEVVKSKLSSLPIAGSLWKEYNEIHKKQKRITDKPSEISVKKYSEILEAKKKTIRTRQSTLTPSAFFDVFAKNLIVFKEERRYFLFWLSHHLERFSRHKENGGDIGVEHMMRELFQVYILHTLNDSPSKKSTLAMILNGCGENINKSLQVTMTDILFTGQPIELFDGDAQGIPDLFFADLMQALESRMGKRNRIGVISVLGVQSSGKSTLLNAMFGCKFTVSSGRCTKGVNLQLISVQKQYAAKFNIDYIFVLDTEGLKSPERQDLMGNNEHDSELATFVVGLSDVVVLNVASESMDALKDIIQITIHAFLRMKNVSYEKTKCLFVHQNTGDPSNHQKLSNERKLFEKTLKELTEIAAKSEIGTTEVSFKDILDYDEETSHEYFPCLYDGTPPMAAINLGYAEKVTNVKESILLSLSKVQVQTPSSFCKRVLQIWEAVLSEDFLYSFKNSMIAFKRDALDVKFAELEWQFRQELKKHVEQFQTEMSNNAELPSLHFYKQRLEELFEEIPDKMLQHIEEYLKDDPISKRLFFEEIRSSVNHLMIKAKTELLELLKSFVERERSKREVDSKEVGLETYFQEQITLLVEQFRSQGKSLDNNEANREFDKLWDCLLDDIQDYSLKMIERVQFEWQVREFLMHNYKRRETNCLKSELKKHESLADFTQYQIDISSLFDQGWFSRLFRGKPKATAEYFEFTKRQIDDLVTSFRTDMERAFGHKDLDFEFWPIIMMQLFNALAEKFDNPAYQNFNDKIRARVTVHIFGTFVLVLENFRNMFLENHDPVRKICRKKEYFKKHFLGLCASRSLASTAAGKFIEDCYIPGITETIGIIIDRVLAAEFKNANKEFTNRKTCEIALLRDTQNAGDFHLYLKLIHQYRKLLDDWLHFKMTDYFNKPCDCDPCRRSSRNKFCHVVFDRTDNLNQSIWAVLDDVLSDSKSDITIGQVLQKISDSSKQNVILKLEKMTPYLNLVSGYEFAEILAKEMEKFQADRFAEKNNWIDRSVRYLIESLIGCGNCCPFCGAPCSLSSSQHDEHSTHFHRPQVIVGYR